VLTGSNDNTARLWDAATGKEIRAFKGHKNRTTRPAARTVGFSCTGQRDKREYTPQVDVTATPSRLQALVAVGRLWQNRITGGADKCGSVDRDGNELIHVHMG
jgi:WD40 repeat protein